MRRPIAIFYRLLRLSGKLPLPILHGLGNRLGWFLWVSHSSLRHKAIRTLSIAFPALSEEERRRLARSGLCETGKSVFEVAKIWSGNAEQALGLIRRVSGGELFEDAVASGRGLIIAAPHLGCWELLNFYLASKASLAIVYRAPKVIALEPLLKKARGTLDVEQVRADGSGVRALYKRLKAGGVVGILPDQQPKHGEGEFAPFFGEPALTMVLVSRLAQRTGAQVLFSFAERLPQGAGFHVHFLPAPPKIADPHLPTAVAALNQGVEACVKLAMPQYQWHYKRYSIRPEDDERKFY